MGRHDRPQGEPSDAQSREAEASQAIDPASLTIDQLATVLSTSGDIPVTRTDIQESIENGLPSNQDGTISLMTFVAWLETQVRRQRRV